MKKKIYILSLLFCVSFLNAYNQAVIEVNPGDDLITAVQDASAGDTIYVMQGLHKAQYQGVVVDKSLVIKGEPGESYPLLYIKQIDVQADDVSFLLTGLEISGFEVDSLTGTENQENVVADYLLNLVSGNTANAFGDISITNSHIRNFNKSIVRGDRDTYTVDNFLFDNIVAHDFRGGSDYGPFRLKSKITFNAFTLTNSTLYDFLNKIIDCQNVVPSPMDVLIENCTFNNMGGGKSGNYLFDIADNDQATLVIQSCILGRTNVSDLVTVNGWRVNELATLQMMNTAMTPDFIVTEGTYAATTWNKTEYNLENFDPEWTDPDNGDFSLPLGSDLLQWSPEGTIIGDPRWNPIGEGIHNLDANPGFRLFPNPASGQVTVRMEKAGAAIEIYNSTGRLVRILSNTGIENTIDISGLNQGIYYLRIAGENRIAKKLLVQ
ncbi:MAG TPA: T9SS type A sorting domain-containing protein [Bacteroidales bacterium]|nr:T9SS type A sorting domain-containing protein [Bacteroidales bacterium]